MVRVGNRFIDPATGDTYIWPLNHNEEQGSGKQRTIEHKPTTGGGSMPVQGDDTPMVLRFEGTILEQAQHDEFARWFELSRHRTIYFRDFQGREYEVLITRFDPVRKRVAANPRDRVNAPLHTWTYSLEMEVIDVRYAGVWA